MPFSQRQHMSRDMTKATKWLCASEDSDQPGHLPSLIRVFAVHSMGSSGPKLSSCGQRRLWSAGRMPRLIWVFAGRTVILLVLSCRGSYISLSHTHQNPTAMFKTAMSVPTYSIVRILFFVLKNKKQKVLSHWYMLWRRGIGGYG